MVLVKVRPNFDLRDDGWTTNAGGTNLVDAIDETTQSDTDFIKSSVQGFNEVAEFRLGNLGTPTSFLSDGIVKLAVGKAVNNSESVNIKASLLQGNMEVASWRYPDVPFGPVLKTEMLSPAQRALITDRSDLRGRVVANPIPEPTMELDFSKPGQTIDSRVSCYRSSSATYVDKNGVIRTTGLNLYPRADLLTLSSGLNDVSVTPGEIAPDGKATAYLIMQGTTNNVHRFIPDFTITASVVYTHTVYLKYLNWRFVSFASYDAPSQGYYAIIDLQNGLIHRTGVEGSATLVHASINAVGNGWYKCIIQGTNPSTTTRHIVSFAPDGSGAPYAGYGSNPFAGDPSKGLLMWGPQTELADGTNPFGVHYPNITSGFTYGHRIDHDPVTLASRGLLHEPQRTNLLLGNNMGGGSAGTVTTNQGVAPDGTNDAKKLALNATGSNLNAAASSGAGGNPSLTNAQHVCSFYVKAGVSGNYAQLKVQRDSGTDYSIVVNLDTGSMLAERAATLTNTGYRIENAGNGWWRLSVTWLNPAADTGTYIVLNMTDVTTGYDAFGNLTITGATGEYILFWGGQVEAGFEPTSYIPTTTTQVTRATDSVQVYSRDLLPVLNAVSGAIVIEGAIPPKQDTYLVTLDDETWANYFGIYTSASDAGIGVVGTGIATTQRKGPLTGNSQGFAMFWGPPDVGTIVDGGLALHTSNTPVQTLTRMVIGSSPGTDYCIGRFRNIKLFNHKPSDRMLQFLTSKRLDLDFTNMGGKLDPRVVNTRSSIGMVIDSNGKVTYGPNNLAVEVFANNWWTGQVNGTITHNATRGPSGLMSATLMTGATSGELRPRVDVGYAGLGKGNYVVSIYVKKGGSTPTKYVRFGVNDSFGGVDNLGFFNLDTGLVDLLIGTATAIMTADNDGWYRISLAVEAIVGDRLDVGLSWAKDVLPELDAVAGATSYFTQFQIERVTYEKAPRAFYAATGSAYYGPRFDYDPHSGDLAVPAARNLIIRANEFDFWALARVTVTTNATIAPDGTLTADKIIDTTDNDSHGPYQSGITTPDNYYCGSFYLKAAERTFATVILQATAYTFDLGNGVLGVGPGTNQYAGYPPTMENVGNGWYRCSVTSQLGLGGITLGVFVARTDIAGPSPDRDIYAGDGTSGLYVWGGQLELSQGPNTGPTPLIVTGSGYLTRPATFKRSARKAYSVKNIIYGDSENFTGGDWGANNTTLTVNATTAPNGASNGTLLTETAAGGGACTLIPAVMSRIGHGYNTNTGSIYVKRGNHDWIVMVLNDNGNSRVRQWFNLGTGTLGSAIAEFAVHINSKITDVGNGWWRISITASWIGGDNATRFYIHSASADLDPNTAIGRTRYHWGAQIELGYGPNEYTKKTGEGQYNGFPLQFAYDEAPPPPETFARNLLTKSQDMAGATWASDAGARTANVAIAPDGTLTADRIEGNGGTANAYIAGIGVAIIPHTWSVYVKYDGTTDWFAFGTYDGTNEIRQYYDIRNGVLGSAEAAIGSGTVTRASIEGVGNGWYRCSMTRTPGAGGAVRFQLNVANADLSVTLVGIRGLLVWGAQLEAGSIHTPYIPTDTVPLTQALPMAYKPKGLLIEAQATNLLSGSSDFSAASGYWVHGNVTVYPNDAGTAAPDGTYTADAIGVWAATETHVTTPQISITPSVPYTFSIYVKRQSTTWKWYYIFFSVPSFEGGASFDLEAGVAGFKSPTIVDSNIHYVGNGWYRIQATSLTPASLFYGVKVASSLNDADFFWSGGQAWLWGAQLEQSPSATSYIPTVASAVTRAADFATISGAAFSSWFTSTEGTVSFVMDQSGAYDARELFAFNSGNEDNSYTATMIANNEVEFYSRAATAVQSTFTMGSIIPNAAHNVVFGYRENGLIGSVRGATPVQDTSALSPIGLSELAFGMNGGHGHNILRAHYKRLTHYRKRFLRQIIQGLSR